MLFTNREIIKWLGFSTFEIFMQLVSFLVFSILVSLKVEGILGTTWWKVFIPTFIADGASLYFSTIVFIRTIRDGNNKEAYRRALWVSLVLTFSFLFKMLLCQYLEGDIKTSTSVVMSPCFALGMLFLLRACKVT